MIIKIYNILLYNTINNIIFNNIIFLYINFKILKMINYLKNKIFIYIIIKK